MPEFRVAALHYRFRSEVEYDHFDRAAPVSGRLGDFDCVLEDRVLKAVPTEEYRDRDAARDALEPYLRNWEQAAFLRPEAYRILFEYDRSDVVKLDPTPGSVTIFVESIASASGVAGNATIRRPKSTRRHFSRRSPRPRNFDS